MKEAIKKAIKNGFDYTITNEPQELIVFEGFSNDFMMVLTCDDPPRRSFTIHELVYKTDFIDKLVGRVHLGRCSCEPENIEICMAEIKSTKDDHCQIEEFIDELKECPMYIKNIADHHRSKMANIKNIEKLKEYVRGLV